MKIAFSGQMKELDRQTIEDVGIPGAVLMENAGRETVSVMDASIDTLEDNRIIVFAGKGNNGGDGFVIARHLYNRGSEVLVFLLGKLSDLDGDAGTHARVADAMQIPVIEVQSKNDLLENRTVIRYADVIVDALFGTGLKRPIEGIFKEAVMLINDSDALVVSVDIPSGLMADTSEEIGPTVTADITVTFGLPKFAQLLYPAALHAGQVIVADISIPSSAVTAMQINGQILCPHHFPAFLMPRSPHAHKGDYGHLLILAGSPGKTGAAILAATAAARAGAGLVTAAVPDPLNTVIESNMIEAMTYPLPGPSPVYHPEHLAAVNDLMIGKSALLIGPGIGTAPETIDFMKQLMADVDIPVIMDADALNIIASSHGPWFNAKCPRVLTPHPGEFSRLTDLDVKSVLGEQLDLVTDYAGVNKSIVVLKTARTLIACPDGAFYINTTGNSGMATGGSGDILSGIISGLIASGMEPGQAVGAGVFWHGLTGDFTAEAAGSREMLAGDMLRYMKRARELILREPFLFNGKTIPYPEDYISSENFLD